MRWGGGVVDSALACRPEGLWFDFALWWNCFVVVGFFFFDWLAPGSVQPHDLGTWGFLGEKKKQRGQGVWHPCPTLLQRPRNRKTQTHAHVIEMLRIFLKKNLTQVSSAHFIQRNWGWLTEEIHFFPTLFTVHKTCTIFFFVSVVWKFYDISTLIPHVSWKWGISEHRK